MSLIHENIDTANPPSSRADPALAKVRPPLAPQEQFANAALEMRLILELVVQRFASGQDPARAVSFLVEEMRVMRRTLSPDAWRRIVALVGEHPVNAMLQEDPFTRWSITKPRGYSGDAVLMDLVYRHPSIEAMLDETSELGRSIFGFTGNAPTSAGSRERRQILARFVDRTAEACAGEAEILAIAAGHLREAEISTALDEGRLKRWVAVDQDPISVGIVQRDYGPRGVETINGSVKGILARRYGLGAFDLVYAAGLYDYLSHKVAVGLTRRCVEMLKPGGTFLFANYHTDTPDEGYMEAFMDWELILRSEAEMWAIVTESVDRNAVDVDLFYGENRTILYAALTKRA